ncbi:hypothetical protein ACSSS7_004980 [Eimeria intestinalis]
MASLTSMLLTATLGGGPRQPSQPLKMPSLFTCGGAEPEPEEKFVNAPPPKQGPIFLRMCILCGNDLAAGDITGTSDPYVDETGTLHFSVYDQDMGVQGDFLGSCQLLIPRRPAKLKKETLFLSSVPAPFFSKPPSSRITVLYHVVERLEDQPDLVQLARRMGDDGSEDKAPKNMTVRCCCLQTEHSSMQDNMVAALRVAVGRQSSISQPGVADGLRYLYGPPSAGWQVEFSLKNVTVEDLVQLRIVVDWMLREGSAEEIQRARKKYIDLYENQASERDGSPENKRQPLAGKGRTAGTSAGQIDPLQDGARTPKKKARFQTEISDEGKSGDERPTLQGYEKALSHKLRKRE